MIEALFGAKYAPFIAASYGFTFIVLAAMVAWVWLGHRARKRELASLDRAGFGRSAPREHRG